MKKLLLGSLIAGLYILANAQQKTAVAVFDQETHDFGQIKEENGLVSYTFSFKNMGGTPLILKNVQASCGCTTPNWSKDPVLPGTKGVINVTYNPANRPGRFEKGITVTTDGDPEIISLKISGEVIPKQKMVEDEFPTLINGLRFKNASIGFPALAFGKKATVSAEVFNSMDQPATVKFVDVPPQITVKVTPEVLGPKQKGSIEVTYDAAIKNDWGNFFDRINLSVNDKKEGGLTISGNITEDFSVLTDEQRKNAPKIKFENQTFDFGTIKQDSIVHYSYSFKNEGNSDLIIRKVQPSCGCTAASLKSSVIKPGESGAIDISFNAHGRTGTQNKNIMVISNDPGSARLSLSLKGIVQ